MIHAICLRMVLRDKFHKELQRVTAPLYFLSLVLFMRLLQQMGAILVVGQWSTKDVNLYWSTQNTEGIIRFEASEIAYQKIRI